MVKGMNRGLIDLIIVIIERLYYLEGGGGFVCATFGKCIVWEFVLFQGNRKMVRDSNEGKSRLCSRTVLELKRSLFIILSSMLLPPAG